MPLHSDGGARGVMLRVDRRASGIGGGSGHNTPPNPLEGDFLFVPPLLFVGLPSLQGDALFGSRPFLSRQVASLSTNPTSHAAAPNADVPPPFALSGASPSLHAWHKEQRFLFLIESFKWLHWWHGHDEARRVADRSTSGVLLREAERMPRQVRHAN